MTILESIDVMVCFVNVIQIAKASIVILHLKNVLLGLSTKLIVILLNYIAG
jgi:hypothetical protein